MPRHDKRSAFKTQGQKYGATKYFDSFVLAAKILVSMIVAESDTVIPWALAANIS